MERPPGYISGLVPAPPPILAQVPNAELAAELLQRVRRRGAAPHAPLTFADPVFSLLVNELELVADVHDNRFSRTNVLNHMSWLGLHLPGGLDFVRGKCVLELGCGGVNPLARLFALLMAGARRGVGVDADEVADVAAACRALAHCAGYALLQPAALFGGCQVTREEVARNLASFDLAKLWMGDSGGIDRARLAFLCSDAARLDLPDRSVDLVMSFAFLEHVADLDAVLAEMARVTVPGGIGVHIIDGADHDMYVCPEVHPLAFLQDRSGARMVHGSNRLRPLQYRPAFERHGLQSVTQAVHVRVPVDEALRASFAEPFASLPQEALEVTGLLVVLRRS